MDGAVQTFWVISKSIQIIKLSFYKRIEKRQNIKKMKRIE